MRRFEAREAELKSLQMRVAEMSAEAESAQESAQRRQDALRLQLSAKQAELDATKDGLAATQARPLPARAPTLHQQCLVLKATAMAGASQPYLSRKRFTEEAHVTLCGA